MRQRLVEDVRARLLGERAAEGDPLSLSARELRGSPRLQAFQLHEAQQPLDSLRQLGRARAAALPAPGAGKDTFSKTLRCGYSA